MAISDVVDDDAAAELMRAAEDGLVVLAGMDATTGVDAVERLVGVFPPSNHDTIRLALSGVLVGTLAQRLAPRVAGHGRVPVVEVIVNSPEVTACLFDEQTLSGIDEIVERGGPLGMQSFATAAAELLMAGTIDLRGLLSVIDDWPRVHRALVDRGVLSR